MWLVLYTRLCYGCDSVGSLLVCRCTTQPRPVPAGYLVLAGRVRRQEECEVVAETLQKHFKRAVNVDNLFSRKFSDGASLV